MTITEDPWTSAAPESVGRKLVQVPAPVLEALGDGDLEAARSLSDQTLTPYMIHDECRSVWKYRSRQISLEPRDALWVTRLLVDTKTGEVLGRAGYHGQPNEDGMVEVGYSIDPLVRRQGHARAALRILIDMAREDPRVRAVRATIQPGNIASTALVKQFGFCEVGEHWDDEYGRGLMAVLEVSVA